MELTIYALIYWNVNFKIEVTKMLNKKLFSTSLVLSMLLVGCSSVDSVQENVVKETPQPEDNGEREIILVREEIPACDDTIPYGAYTSYDAANSAAKAALNEAAIREGWFSSHYGVDTHQTECGTIYYTYWYEEFVGN